MIPLSIIVACSKDKKIDFTIEKTKYKNVISTKTKSQISALHAQNAGIIPAEIGYSPPSIANGIISNYKLKQGWHGTNNDKLTIEVALSKSGKEVKKNTRLKPSDSVFLKTELAKYEVSHYTETKTHIGTLPALNTVIIPAKIGYSPPSIANGIISNYKLKQGWHGTNSDELTIEVTLLKSGKEVKKDITVMPSSKFMDIEFAKYKNGISSKTRDEILNDIDSKKQGFTDQLFFLYDRGNKSDNKRDYAIKQKLFNIFGYSLLKLTKELTIRFQWVDVLDKNNNSDYSFKLKIDICTQDKSKTKTIIIKTSDAP